MLVANISDFGKDIKSYLDKVAKNFVTLIINRGKEENIVIMSLEKYNSLMATNYKLSSQKMKRDRTLQLKNLKGRKSFTKDLIEK